MCACILAERPERHYPTNVKMTKLSSIVIKTNTEQLYACYTVASIVQGATTASDFVSKGERCH